MGVDRYKYILRFIHLRQTDVIDIEEPDIELEEEQDEEDDEIKDCKLCHLLTILLLYVY